MKAKRILEIHYELHAIFQELRNNGIKLDNSSTYTILCEIHNAMKQAALDEFLDEASKPKCDTVKV